MKTLQALVVVKSIALAAFVAAGLGTSPLSHATPDDGVRCPAGFDAQLSGGALKCVKQVSVDLTNTAGRECTQDAPFRNFQRMSGNQRDICVHDDSNIPGNANLADFENGIVVVRIPVGAQLPRSLQNRQPIRVVNGIRFFRINENADFIFYDRSKTVTTLANLNRVAQERVAERQLNVPSDQVEGKVASVTTTQVDASGSLDRIEGKINLFTFARPQ